MAGKPLLLDRQIGKGGEGDVYLIAGDATKAVKLYTTADRLSREEKVQAMVQSGLSSKTSLAAFPVAVVHRNDGSFAGFVMRLVGGHRPIHELYAPGSRKQHFPQADYRFLARSATNIAKAFASVHRTGCVVGDINHSGVLVSSQATAALIDADSFQFTAGGKQYLCKVGVPEYTPPELQGKSLQGVVRTVDHDAFGLAVVLFQVLVMGRHPFVGRVRQGEMPTHEESIKDFRYAYAEDRDVGMDQPPGTPAMSDFSPELAALFNRAFSKSTVGQRPTAQDWVAALERFEATLVQCADNPLHYGPKNALECPWCDMERQYGSFLFLPYVGSGATTKASDSTGADANFDLRLIWARIERVVIPTAEQLQPALPAVRAEASSVARAAKEAKGESTAGSGVMLLAVALTLVVLAPKAWIIAVGLGIWGLSRFKDPPVQPVSGQPFKDAFVAAKKQWFQELEGWRRRTGFSDLIELKQKLTETRDRYAALAADESRQAEQYRAQRRTRQLQSYLEGFDLARASIKGIGHAKLAALASYGIDTAADVSQARVMNVPGFGEALTRRVLEWRRRHEARFIYNAADNDADRQELARIRALTEAKAGTLRSTLARGAQELEARQLRCIEFAKRVDPALAKLHERIEQAMADLAFLNVPEPHVAAPALAQQAARTQANPPRRVSAPASQPHSRPTGNPSCPRCGSSMQRRLAGRGRNAGNFFWGCTRYPNCKGTRPI